MALTPDQHGNHDSFDPLDLHIDPVSLAHGVEGGVGAFIVGRTLNWVWNRVTRRRARYHRYGAPVRRLNHYLCKRPACPVEMWTPLEYRHCTGCGKRWRARRGSYVVAEA